MTVDREHQNITTRQIPEGLFFGCAILLAVVLVSFPFAGWVSYLRYGMTGVAASAVAAFVCGSAAIMALVFTIVTRNTPNAVAGLFFLNLFANLCPAADCVYPLEFQWIFGRRWHFRSDCRVLFVTAAG